MMNLTLCRRDNGAILQAELTCAHESSSGGVPVVVLGNGDAVERTYFKTVYRTKRDGATEAEHTAVLAAMREAGYL